MGRRCCVGACDNDDRYPNKVVKRGNIKEVHWYKFPVNKDEKDEWSRLVSKGREGFSSGWKDLENAAKLC